MDFDALALIATDSAGFADAAALDLAAPVEHCPGWTVADLVFHLLRVQDFWGQVVADRLVDGHQATEIDRPADSELVATFRAGAARFVDILAAADPDTHVWTWAPQQDVAFVIRHQVQETAVHRWDAENAVGRRYTIDPAGAADAIEEFLAFSLIERDEQAPGLGGPITLLAGDRAWTLAESPGRTLTWRRAAADDATTVSGSPSDLLLWLYHRVPTSALAVTGDASRLDRLAAYTETS